MHTRATNIASAKIKEMDLEMSHGVVLSDTAS